MDAKARNAGAAWGATGQRYECFSEDFADALAHCVQRIVPREGERVLDVATGTGWTARLIASRGAVVTGLDYSEELILAAREIARQQGLDITFDIGDAHALPYPDHSFDIVVSTFGVITASDPEQASAELARVCRPGGRLGLSVWAEDCTLNKMSREVSAKFASPGKGPPPLSPFEWGTEERMKELLESSFELKFEKGCTILREPDGESVWRLWSKSHGPTATRLKALDADAQNAFKEAFIEFHEQFRSDLGIAMPRDYIIAIGTRR